MIDQELLDRLLAFWERVSNDRVATSELRRELVELVFAFRAQGLREGALVLRRARREYGARDIDAVSRYVMARVEEELQRRALGQPASAERVDEANADTPPH